LIAEKNVFAYELLFRNGIGNFMPEIDGDVATSTLLSNSYLLIGIDKITAGKPAFVNFTQNLLEKELPLLFSKDSTVVEIFEDVQPDPAVLALVALSKLTPTKPDEWIRSSCIKARFCKSLGIIAGKPDLKIELFPAGMFSNIDAVLDQPLKKSWKSFLSR
jgi:c-di-GMP-related signal transduction protein